MLLRIPTDSDRNAVLDFKSEFLGVYPDHIPGAPALARSERYEVWLATIETDLHTPEPGHVIATQYIAVDSEQGRIIGVVQLRHDLTPYLLQHGGHIGYSVRPSEQGKGYATEILHLCLKQAQKIGLNKVLVTCDVDNLGSSRVIEKNGGVYENTVDKTKRYWISIDSRDSESV